MATFSDIKTRVGYYLKRSTWYDASGNDVSTAALNLFVNGALIQLQRFLPVTQAIEASWTVSIGPGNHPFQTASLSSSPTFNPTSATFRYEYDLWSASAGKGTTPLKPLRRYADIREYHKDWPDPSLGVVSPTTGAPRGFLIYGQPQGITLGPYPDTTYTMVLTGVMWLPALVASTDSNWYCVTPSTRVLGADLRWKRAGDLSVGSQIIGFDGNDSGPGSGERLRRIRNAVITSHSFKRADVYRVILEDGTVLTCTGEHRWLTCPALRTGAIRWCRTDDLLRSGHGGRHKGSPRGALALPRFFSPWEEDASHDAGYLAAAFDGEGALEFRSNHGRNVGRVQFAQNPGTMLDHVTSLLNERGFGWDTPSRCGLHGQCLLFSIRGGREESYRFLGSIRPIRLLEKWRDALTRGLPMSRINAARISAIEPAGNQEIAAISSSTGTYIAEGFGAHNTLNADDALTFLACQEAAVWLQDDALAAYYEKMAMEKIKQLLRAQREQEMSEEGYQAQLFG